MIMSDNTTTIDRDLLRKLVEAATYGLLWQKRQLEEMVAEQAPEGPLATLDLDDMRAAVITGVMALPDRDTWLLSTLDLLEPGWDAVPT
jgi:hypothetical protein